MINGSRYSMRRGSCCEDIHDETFIIAMYREVHVPAVFRTPMPVKDILIPPAVPVPVYFTPEFVDSCCQHFFLITTVDVILMDGK